MNKAVVQQGQSILDVALQQCGNIEAIFEMAALNSISVTDDLPAGNSLVMPEAKDGKVVSYYSVNRVTPATAVTLDEINQHPVGGINFMGIELDFIVS